MSRIFVSHASTDKALHVLPLVEALLHENFLLWIDRPGMGENNLGLTQEAIARHDVRGIPAGGHWDEQILEAQRQCGAVLVCLSRAMSAQRQVLVHELLLARYTNKLVACIVDDLPFELIPQDLGLAIPSRLQAPRIDTASLAQALRRLRESAAPGKEALTPALRVQWEVFLQLAADLRAVLRRHGAHTASEEDMALVVSALKDFAHAPMVRYLEVPQALVELLVSRFDSPVSARAHVVAAMQLALASRDEGDTEKQVVVSAGELPQPEFVPLENY